MRKIIRLTESDIIGIVNRVRQQLNEQNIKTIKGTTSDEPIVNPKVFTDAKLPATKENFLGRWELVRPGLSETFRNGGGVGLGKFTYLGSAGGVRDYFEVTVSRFLRKEVKLRDGSTVPQETLDTATEPKVESLSNEGTKTFNTRYFDEDTNYIWSITKVVASGNGLLAFSRALQESTGVPNQITIGFKQERTSGAQNYNAADILSVGANFNAVLNVIAQYIIYVNVGNELGKYQKCTNQTLTLAEASDVNKVANKITTWIKVRDNKFVPKGKQVNLAPTDDSAFAQILGGVEKNRDVIRQIFSPTTGANLQSLVERTYGGIINQIKAEYEKQYKDRIISYFNTVNIPNAVKEIENGKITYQYGGTIGHWVNSNVNGCNMGKGATPATAQEKKTSSGYELGSSTPKTK